MKTADLRKEIKKNVDRIPVDRLASLADYVAFLSNQTIEERILRAEQDLRAGKGTPWRKVRNDV